MHWHRSGRSHTPWIASLLVASLLLVVLLAINAAYAMRSHRAVAEGVLRDYAALAGDELLRRVAAEVGYYGHEQALELLRAAALDPSRPLAQTASRAGGRAERSLELVARAFLLDPTTRTLTALGASSTPPPPSDLVDWLVDRAPTGLSDGSGSLDRNLAVLQRGSATFVVAFLEPDQERASESVPTIVGFELDRARLQPWISAALERRPLLPPSLGSGRLGNGVLYLRLTDASGNEILRSGERYAAALRVTRTLPEDYLQPLVDLRVEAAIDPAAASRLVIGGLPRSRLPILLTLVALTTGLVLAAVVLLRRERTVARLRTDFVARVSHELRTPLTQIRMFAETLRLGRVRDDDERDRALEIVDRESRRLSGLVENILQFSRVEHNAVRLAKETILVHELFESLVQEAMPMLPDRDADHGVRFQIDSPQNLEIVADPDALRQSLLNLLDNALKYGPPRQLVILGAERYASQVRLWVDDEGPGIGRAHRDLVWGAFRRIEKDSGGAISGTGIGLAVVRELIELHGGRCWIDEGSRRGARVVLELPAEAALWGQA